MNKTVLNNTVHTLLKSRLQWCMNSPSISVSTVEALIEESRKIFESMPSLLRLEGNYVVVGDLHGNIDDLIRIFQQCSYPPKQRYVFLGDYVDRGAYGTDVMIFLFALMVLYPKNIYLLRGNHECEEMTTAFGFKNECVTKYSSDVYAKFIDCFRYMPFAAVINGRIFCTHGGISPDVGTLEQIEELEKPMYINESLISNGLLWSDPRADIDDYQENDRGAGYYYSEKNLDEFLKKNKLEMLIRSHEPCCLGYFLVFENNKCATIFSNGDYCGIRNDFAVAIVSKDSPVDYEVFNLFSHEEYLNHRIIFPDWILQEDNSQKTVCKQTIDFSEDQLFNYIQSFDFSLDF